VESGLLPGALPQPESSLRLPVVTLRIETTNTPHSAATRGQLMKVRSRTGEGCYFADERTLDMLASRGSCGGALGFDNPNETVADIAGDLQARIAT
jgi:phosphoribosylformylglycinamidine synthase